jgi:hypothetical protein
VRSRDVKLFKIQPVGQSTVWINPEWIEVIRGDGEDGTFLHIRKEASFTTFYKLAEPPAVVVGALRDLLEGPREAPTPLNAAGGRTAARARV